MSRRASPPTYILRKDGRPKYITARLTATNKVEVRLSYNWGTKVGQKSFSVEYHDQLWEAYNKLVDALLCKGHITPEQAGTMRLDVVWMSWKRYYARKLRILK